MNKNSILDSSTCVSFTQAIENICFLISIKKIFLKNRKFRRLHLFSQKIQNWLSSLFLLIFIAVKLKFSLTSLAEYVNENQHFVQNDSNQISRLVQSNIVSNSKINKNSDYVVILRSGDLQKPESEYAKPKQIVSEALKRNSDEAKKKINEILTSSQFISDGSLMNFLQIFFSKFIHRSRILQDTN